ncbi:MAG: VanZ family protein [Candidatus Marinimicrobia bacterium]|nr:VanZ family protein [Candidatus Neomarinimicrobiota bacterium]MCH8068215.1 VanZ family protein [Candidatus Neomarinimicrobiota bacterium]
MNVNKYRILLVAYCTLILIISSIPGTSIPKLPFLGWDKLIHFLEYAGLGWLLVQSLTQKKLKFVMMVIIAGMVFGIFDELFQYFIPRRISSVADWFADSAGLIVGGFLVVSKDIFHKKELNSKV